MLAVINYQAKTEMLFKYNDGKEIFTEKLAATLRYIISRRSIVLYCSSLNCHTVTGENTGKIKTYNQPSH